MTPVKIIPDPNLTQYIAYATYDPLGNPIILLGPKYYTLTPLIQKFTMYHESSHLSIPTSDEILANCTALKRMREEGLSVQNEKIIKDWHISQPSIGFQYGGTGLNFWTMTIQCSGDRNNPNAQPANNCVVCGQYTGQGVLPLSVFISNNALMAQGAGQQPFLLTPDQIIPNKYYNQMLNLIIIFDVNYKSAILYQGYYQYLLQKVN